MRQNIPMVLVMLLATCLMTKADVPVFGNFPNGSSGFDIVAYNTSMNIGAAVEFTPLEDIDVSSVTIWLSGYSGIYGQTMYASICSNNPHNTFGTAANGPGGALLTLTSAAPNDGSLAAFTFSGSAILSANTSYWLVLDSEETQIAPAPAQADWVGGGAPTGDAIYDGSVVYSYLPSPSINTSSIVPAFTINAVPEPGVAALMSIPLIFGLGRAFFKRQMSRS